MEKFFTVHLQQALTKLEIIKDSLTEILKKYLDKIDCLSYTRGDKSSFFTL